MFGVQMGTDMGTAGIDTIGVPVAAHRLPAGRCSTKAFGSVVVEGVSGEVTGRC